MQSVGQALILDRDSPYPTRGAIVNVSSLAGLMGNGDIPSYVATKHAVVGLSTFRSAFACKMISNRCPGRIEIRCSGNPRQRTVPRVSERSSTVTWTKSIG
jgi:NAD(P)-dependent dehydrogenase (short-subunit alcohol dehydrogenase family)